MLYSLQSYFHMSFDLCTKIEGGRTHDDYYYSHVKTEAQKGQVTFSGPLSQPGKV